MFCATLSTGVAWGATSMRTGSFRISPARRHRSPQNRRGAKILGEILGYGATCEAYHRVRLLEDGREPARAMSLALAEACVHPEAVDYVALHGTSTRLNDVVETRAVKRALGDHARKIPMSALKSMIGHPQGASGAAGVVATLLSMRDRFVHPTINLANADADSRWFWWIPPTDQEHGSAEEEPNES